MDGMDAKSLPPAAAMDDNPLPGAPSQPAFGAAALHSSSAPAADGSVPVLAAVPTAVLHRSTTVAAVADGREATWPAWLADAKQAFPLLHATEIRSLHDMFERHATDESGEPCITKSGVTDMLGEALKDLFDKIDTDGSGSLEREEVETLVGDLGKELTKDRLDEVMDELDVDGDGQVSFVEFKEWWDSQQFQSEEDRDVELSDLFEQVDTDGSGEIDWDEFLVMVASQLSREDKFKDPDHEPVEAATIVRTALEAVRADVRAIYGTNSRQKTRLELRSKALDDAYKRRCFFRPESRFRKSWDLVQVLMLFYVAVAVPLRIGFNIEAKPDEFGFYWEVVVDLYFWFDIFVQFRSAYLGVDKNLITDSKLIRGRYFRSWFFIDVASCLPVTYIELILKKARGEEDLEANQSVKLMKILRLLRLAKLLRLARINRLLQRLENEYEGLAAVLKIWKIILTIIFVAHLVACLWYYVGSQAKEYDGVTTLETHPDEAPGTPLYKTFGSADSIESPGSVLEGWVVKNGWDCLEFDPECSDATLFTRYLDAFYYSVTTLTTVGYGDRTPFTNSEKVFSILAELAGCIIFGIIAGSLGALAMSTSMAAREMKYERERLDEFLKIKQIPSHLRQQVVEQMDNWFDQKSVFDEQAILERLPPKHRKELLMEMYSDHLSTCPLLKGMEEGIVSKLCLQMLPYLALEGDTIVKEGDVGEEMYMVVRGTIKLASDSYELYNDRNWVDGAFFGELTVLGIGAGAEHNRHVYSASASVQSDCIFITQNSLDTLQLLYPTFKFKMRDM